MLPMFKCPDASKSTPGYNPKMDAGARKAMLRVTSGAIMPQIKPPNEEERA